MSSQLSGTAFITGAGSGIGQAAAIAFAESGVSNLALADIRAESLKDTIDQLEKIGNIKTLTLEMDVSKEADVVKAIQDTVKEFGSVDYAVNNAGVAGPNFPTGEMPLDGWQRCLDINLNGVFLCQKEEIKQMLQQSKPENPRRNKGVIINVASMLGTTGVPKSMTASAYVASKHAVVGLTKTDGTHYAEKDIRINAICPGYVETPLLQQSLDETARNVLLAQIPAARLASMEEIASAIVFLASPMSSYMFGGRLLVDGAYTCY